MSSSSRSPSTRTRALGGYHVTGYFAPVSRLGSPDEFRHLVDALHQAGIGVIIDWVPGHFATDPWALPRFDGTALYEHEDPRLGWHPDWGAYIFNFGRNEVKSFLLCNSYYWLHEFHIDGLRIDAVASMLYLDYSRKAGEWVPNKYGGNENLEAVALLQQVNSHNYRREPGTMMIAEESTSWPGVTRDVAHDGLGFGFKWNMGWMNDSLRYYGYDPINRQHHHDEMTFAMSYAYSENFILPISHDEVVHGKGSMFERAPGGGSMAQVRDHAGLLRVHVVSPGQTVVVHGHGVRPAPGVQRAAGCRLGGIRQLGALRRPAAGQGSQRHLSGASGPALAGQRSRRLHLDRPGCPWRKRLLIPSLRRRGR